MYNKLMQNVRHLPIGIQSFEAVRTGSYVYVDKTHFIPKLELVGRAYFLIRPRRFGKSLFVSMLQAYFEGRTELFKGLAIEKYKKETGSEWQSYPILKLDLNAKEYTKEEHLGAILNYHIDKWKADYEIETEYKYPDTAFAYIIKTLYEKFNKKVVILIDEYDKPLIATLENEKLHEQYRTTLKAFYSVIKNSNDYIHMSFLTGITKFGKVSIFSDLNNLDDISFDREYSSICGMTEEELKSSFSPEVEGIACEYNRSYEEMLGMLRAKYDGYRFSKKDERLYNPFSLLNALVKKELGDYWFSTGTPTFLVRFLERRTFNIPDLEGNIKLTLDNLDIYRATKDNLIPFLFQAGYITIKDYDRELNRYLLGFPNNEVRYAFLKNLLKVYTTAHTANDGTFIIDEFLDAIRGGDIERVLSLATSLIASIPYDSFKDDASEALKKASELREHNYQTAIYLIFRLLGQYVRCEVHSSKGRSDVEVETGDAIYIFEFKMKGSPSLALSQIKDAGYAQKYEASSKSIFLIGVSINHNKKTLGKWQIEKVK